MKKKILAVFIALAILSLCGCGLFSTSMPTLPSSEIDEPTPEPDPTVYSPTIPAEIMSNETCIIIVPEGWQYRELQNEVQVYRGSNIVSVSVEDTEETEDIIKLRMEAMQREYNGSEIEEVKFLKTTFYRTVFDYYDTPQTYQMGIVEGKLIRVAMSGLDHLIDDTMMAVYESIHMPGAPIATPSPTPEVTQTPEMTPTPIVTPTPTPSPEESPANTGSAEPTATNNA